MPLVNQCEPNREDLSALENALVRNYSFQGQTYTDAFDELFDGSSFRERLTALSLVSRASRLASGNTANQGEKMNIKQKVKLYSARYVIENGLSEAVHYSDRSVRNVYSSLASSNHTDMPHFDRDDLSDPGWDFEPTVIAAWATGVFTLDDGTPLPLYTFRIEVFPENFIKEKVGKPYSENLEDTVSFNLTHKLSQSLKDILYVLPPDQYPPLWGGDQAVANPRMISFFNKPEQYREWLRLVSNINRTKADEYRDRVAVMTRPGRFFGKFGIKDPQVLEELTSRFVDYTFEIVSGEDIKKYYHGSTYVQYESTSLQSSCMKHDNCQDFFGVYVDHCRMMISKDSDGRIYGRAIIWDAVKLTRPGMDPENIIFMDRIYGSDVFVHSAKRWARENGYWHKLKQNFCSHRSIVDPQGGEWEHAGMSFHLDTYDYDYWPYMDTMYVWNEGSELKNGGCGRELTDTEGNNEDRQSCSNCGCTVYDDEVYLSPDWDEPLCESCYNDMYASCSECGTVTSIDELSASENGDAYCDECVEAQACSHCGTIVGSSNLRNTDDGDALFCPTCLIGHDCQACGGTFVNEAIEQGDDGVRRCVQCTEEHNARLEAKEQEAENERTA